MTQIVLGTLDKPQDVFKLEFKYDTNSTSHDNNGSMLEQKITVPTVGSNPGFTATQTYLYDDLNRLQSATETIGGGQTWKQTFTFDRYGNRRFDAANTTTISSCAAAVCNPNINTSDNRFSGGQGYSYDANGDVTQDATIQRFTYDAENHQKEFFNSSNPGSVPDATYYYDGEAKRVKKISSTETTVFVYDASGKLVAEYSTAIVTTQQVSYLTQDHLGSQRIVTNENGAVTDRKDYSAFGEETISAQRTTGVGYTAAQEPRKNYTGYEKDTESGLEFAQARYYSATHGRFTSVDSLMASATIKNPQTFNRYSYVLNSPYKFTDPLGLLPASSHSGGGNGFCAAENSSCEGGAGKAPGEAEYENRLHNTYNAIDANRAIQRGDQTTAKALCAANLTLQCNRNEETSVSIIDNELTDLRDFIRDGRDGSSQRARQLKLQAVFLKRGTRALIISDGC